MRALLFALGTLLFSTLLSTTAAAAQGNGRAGLGLPGAAPSDHLVGEIALGAGLGIGADENEEMTAPTWSASADAIWAPGDRFVLEAQGVFGPEWMVAVASARYVASRGEKWAVAPWLGSMLLGPIEEGRWDLMPALGCAVDYRSGAFGFDASVPIVGVLLLRESPFVLPGPIFSEIGVTWHASDATSLRVGLASYLPTLRWRHELGGFFYEVDIASVGIGFYQARGGLRF